MNQTKSLVIIANIQILKTLSENLTERGYEILRQLPMITTPAVKDIIQLKPDCIIMSEGSQFDDGFTLLKTIRTLKSQYKTRIIVHTSTRRKGDGLLSDLITLNVYDFIKDSSFDLSEIITLLENPREYTDVAEYHNYAKESDSLDIPLDLPLEMPQEISLLKQPTIPESPPLNIQIIEKRMFGTTTISVSSLQHGSGATYTTLAIASYLSDRGFKVAIVELKQKNDYSLIYFSRKKSYTQSSFQHKTFDIYANDGEITPDDLLIAAMAKNYNYIVIDAGLIFSYELDNGKLDKPDTKIKKFEKGIFYNDFMKADVKLVNSFASDQYTDSLEYLMNYIDIWDITDMKLLFNFTNEHSLKRYMKYFDSETFITPYNAEPTFTEEQNVFYSQLLDKILPKERGNKVAILGKGIKKFIGLVGNLILNGASKAPVLIRRKN